MQKSVIIVAGGYGSRMNSEIPKQFLEINGKPILMHSIEKFYHYNHSINIIVVLPKNQIEYWNSLVNNLQFSIKLSIAKGGKTRFDSVKNGLEFVDKGLVGIHDAVRPFVSIETIRLAFEMAKLKGNAIPVISVNDSIRLITNIGNNQIDRNLIKIVQTPQCFDVKLIKQAYLQDYQPNFTDDASVLEKSGSTIYLSEGNIENIKITSPLDLKIANSIEI